MEENISVNYEWLVKRQWGLNQAITQNQIDDPKKEDKAKQEQNLINLGAIQIINEIIEKYPPQLKK